MVDPDNVEERSKIEAAIEERRRQYAAVLAAGEVANSLALGFTVDFYEQAVVVLDAGDGDRGSGSDESELEWMATEYLSLPGAEEFVVAAYRDAHGILVSRWSDVERLAGELVSRRRLTRDDLWELIPPA